MAGRFGGGGDREERGGGGGGGGRGGRGGGDDDRGGRFGRRRVCRFCADKDLTFDYKVHHVLKYYVTERGRIVPRRISGNCAKHQRKIARAVKQARAAALLPYVSDRV